MLGDGLEGDDLWFLARLLNLRHDQLNRFNRRFQPLRANILSKALAVSVILHTPRLSLSFRGRHAFA